MKRRTSPLFCTALVVTSACATVEPPPRSGEATGGTLEGVPAHALDGVEARPWSCPPVTWAAGQRFTYDVRTGEGARFVDAAAEPAAAPFALHRALRFEYEVTAAPVVSSTGTASTGTASTGTASTGTASTGTASTETAVGATRLRVRLTRLEQTGPRAADLEGLSALVGVPFQVSLDARGAPAVVLTSPAIERCFGAEAALTGAGLGADAAGLLQAACTPFLAVPRGRALAPGDRWGDHERGLQYRYLGGEAPGTLRVLAEPLDDDDDDAAARRLGEWVVRPAAVVRLSADGAPLGQPEARWARRHEDQSYPGGAYESSGSLAFSRVGEPSR